MRPLFYPLFFLLNIPVRLHSEGVKSYGVFNELHGFPSGADLSDQFKNAANKYYGTAFPAFIAKLIENLDREKLIAWLSQKQVKPCLKVYRVVSAVSGFKKLNLLAYSEQGAIKQFSNILGVKPGQAVIWYGYPLQSSVSERG